VARVDDTLLDALELVRVVLDRGQVAQGLCV
jgi:hypothetical protein